ncbi:MAG: EAL domain-containing protein, partial [Pseudomonadota bacterium]
MHARDVVSTNFTTASVDLTAVLERFETEKPQLAIQMPPDASGSISTMTAVARNFALRHRWAVFSLRNQDSVPQDLVISANWQAMVGSGLYWPKFSRQRILSLQSSPGLQPTRLNQAREDAYAFRINPGETVTYAIEVSGEGLSQLVLWKRGAYAVQRQEVATFQGLLLGFALLISIMVVCLFVIRPQWVFPAAALFVWSATAFLTIEFGYVGFLEQFFPQIPALGDKAKATTEALMTVGLLGCLLTFVELRKRMMVLAVLVIAAMLAGFGLAAWAWFRPEVVSGISRMGFGASAFLACLTAMLLASRGAVRAKASMFFFASALIWAAAAFVGIEGLADTPSLEYLIKSGLVLVMGVLALILARFAFSRGVIHSRFFEDSGRRALALAGSEQCVWDWQEENGLLYVGPELERALGVEQGTLTRGGLRAWLALINPADRAGYVSAVEAAVARGRGTFSQEFRLRRADDTYRWYELRARAMPGEHGRAIRCIGTLGDITSSKRAEESLLFDAVRDRITQLPNRVLFVDRLDRDMRRAANDEDVDLHVLVVDLDRFKNVNDSLGHVAGDALLRTMARRLGTLVSEEDTLARLAGDQFGVIADTSQSDRTVEDFANEICRTLAEPCEIGEREVFMTASVGIASWREDSGSAEDLLKDAEIALYEAKRRGKDSVRTFDPSMRDERPELLHLESELRRALERDEMEVLYQPIMHMDNQELAGFEALIRWRHPKRGLLLPEEFIGLAEESGLIEELGRFVLYEAARQLGIWQRAFRPKQPLFMSINVSHAQLLGRHLVDEVRTLLSREDLADGTLKLEITESMVMENPELSVQVLRRLKQLGVGLACDDFGTGYSSLATLQRLPFDVLKLDKSFLEADPEDESAEIILQSIIDLADNLDMAVVAEGVESAEQAERLQDMGCDFGQGYLFGEPMTSRKVIDSLGGSALLLRYTTAKTGGFLKRLVGGGKRSGDDIELDLPEERERRPFRPSAEAAIPPPPRTQPAAAPPPPPPAARQFDPPLAAAEPHAPRPLDDGFAARPATPPLRSEPPLTANLPVSGGRRLPARTDEL